MWENTDKQDSAPDSLAQHHAQLRRSKDSMTVKVQGHEFVAYFDWIGADDSVGQRAHADLAEIYIDECPDDVADILSVHVRHEIECEISRGRAA